jgi:transmembrane sensor
MNTEKEFNPHRISAGLIAEASRWFGLLHGPHRTSEADLLFRKWLAASAENEAAYDIVTTTWEHSQGLPKPPLSWRRAGYRAGFMRAIGVVAATCVIAAIGWVFFAQQAGIRTGVGEQRALALEDGTRVLLNTDTRVVVRFDVRRRVVELHQGEAMFEVRKDATRPFVVNAGGQEITALGTVFVVKKMASVVAVSLIEGKVSIAPLIEESSERTPAPVQWLKPGERVTFGKRTSPTVDTPAMEKVTAWQRGRVELERTPLYQAAEEMNRYSATRLIVSRPEAQVIPVTGGFRAGDIEGFAQTLAAACHLELVRREGEIELAGEPSQNCR